MIGFPGVFDIKKRPWINAEGASSQQIIDKVKKCPSGALITYMNKANQKEENISEVKITLAKNGPLLVNGTISIQDSKGKSFATGTTTALCCCGGSANKPFCDGSHVKFNFKGQLLTFFQNQSTNSIILTRAI